MLQNPEILEGRAFPLPEPCACCYYNYSRGLPPGPGWYSGAWSEFCQSWTWTWDGDQAPHKWNMDWQDLESGSEPDDDQGWVFTEPGATGMHYGPARCGLADWGHDWYFKVGPYYDPCKAPNLQVYPERGLYHEPPVGPPVPVAAPAVPAVPDAAPAVPQAASDAGPDTDDSGDSGSAVSVASSTDTATGDGIGQVTYLVREGPGPIVAGRINYLVREAILQNGIPVVIPRPSQPPPAAPAAPAAEPEAGPGASQGLFSGFIAANPGLDLPWDNFALQDAPMEPAVPEMPVEPEVPVQPQELAPIQEEPVEPVVPEFGPCASEPSESRRVLYIGEPSESGASASGS